MKNRKAWGLVAVLAVLLLGGAVVMIAHYQSRLPQRQQYLTLLSPQERGFGSTLYSYWFDPPSQSAPVVTERWFRLGFFQVRLERHEAKPRK
jgi:hypothetical protein